MSIENNLKRIADSLEIIAGVMDDFIVKAGEESVAGAVPLPDDEPLLMEVMDVPSPTPAPVVKKAVVPTPPPVATIAPADRIATVENGIDINTVNITIGNVTMSGGEFNTNTSSEDLNALIVEEYHRLGSQDGIMKVLEANGCKDISGLDRNNYYYVLTAIRELS